MLAAVLQFFMVLVQQAIVGICFEVLFEVRRHQHISTSTNPQLQSPGNAAARLVVHKHAFHTTAKCVAMVRLVNPSQTRRVVEMFISDVQSESTTTSVKLLALISIGEMGRHRWVGTCGWGHLAMTYVHM